MVQDAYSARRLSDRDELNNITEEVLEKVTEVARNGKYELDIYQIGSLDFTSEEYNVFDESLLPYKAKRLLIKLRQLGFGVGIRNKQCTICLNVEWF